jgi:hypothetical protein
LLQPGQFLLVDENVRVLEFHAHFLGVGHEVRRDVAAVEPHALDHLKFGRKRLGLLDRDHPVVADFLHGVREKASDLGIAIRRDGGDLRNLLVVREFLGILLEVVDDRIDGEIDAALQVHRVHVGRYGFGALLDDRGGEYGGGRGAVTRLVRGLRCDLAHHLGAHVLELVLELDLLGDGDAVLGDAWRAEALVEYHIAALRAERNPHGIVEDVDTAQHLVARFG